MQQPPPPSSRERAVESLKEVVTIVTGVTVAYAIVILLTGGDFARVQTFRQLSPITLVLFVLLIANIIRFYHGNVRLLEDTYLAGGPRNPRSRNLGVDFLIIFMQSILFSAMSFYITIPDEFFIIFLVLLVLDAAWYLFTLGYAANQEQFVAQRNWTFNNVGAILGLFALAAFAGPLPQDVYLGLQIALVAINTLVDYILNWPTYFPSK